MRAWLMSLDGPPHIRARGLVRREFTPRRVEALEPMIRDIVTEATESVEATPEGEIVDLIEAFALPVPSQVIRRLFGLEAGLWASEIDPIFRREGPKSTQGVAMIEAISDFFERQMCSDSHPDGLLKALSVPDPELGTLDRLEVIANAVLLVTAAIDTTKGLIGNALQCLFDRPELLARLRARPELVPAAIEETLRFEPPALSCSRYAHEKLILDGVEIPAGSQILLGLAAANRDPERYPDPDRFDVDRDQTGLLSFGGGRHFCLGAALARSEARIALERLLVEGRCDFERVGAPAWDPRNPTVRALEELPVRVRPRPEPARAG
jgi:cytochrome P450